MFNPVLRNLAQSIYSGKNRKADILATSRESRPLLVRHKPDVQPWLKISDLESRTNVYAAKTKKKPISYAMSAHLVSVPVFTFAKSKFSHGVTQLILSSTEDFLHYNISFSSQRHRKLLSFLACCLTLAIILSALK